MGQAMVKLSERHRPDGQGTRLVLEIARLSPHAACLFITGGVINPADALDDFTVLKQPFKTRDLIDAVQATVVRSRSGRS